MNILELIKSIFWPPLPSPSKTPHFVFPETLKRYEELKRELSEKWEEGNKYCSQESVDPRSKINKEIMEIRNQMSSLSTNINGDTRLEQLDVEINRHKKQGLEEKIRKLEKKSSLLIRPRQNNELSRVEKEICINDIAETKAREEEIKRIKGGSLIHLSHHNNRHIIFYQGRYFLSGYNNDQVTDSIQMMNDEEVNAIANHRAKS